MSGQAGGCAGHAGLPGEVRTALLGALDRLGPALDRLRTATAEPDAADRPCEICPICALIAVLRGERSELAVRAADHAAGLVAVLRAALDEGVGAPGAADESAPRNESAPMRTVQHISVHR